MERDDVIEYSLDNHHSEEEGIKIRKKIWVVTAILSIITIAEVGVGIFWGRNVLGEDSAAWWSIKIFYIILTLVKAGYIILVFMHLGDERKSFKSVILVPYIIFIIYAMFLIFIEGAYLNTVWTS